MGLFQHAHGDGDIGQWAGPVSNSAGLALEGQAEAFIDHGIAHLDVREDGLEAAFDRLDRASRSDIAAFHAQDAGLLARNDVGRVE